MFKGFYYFGNDALHILWEERLNTGNQATDCEPGPGVSDQERPTGVAKKGGRHPGADWQPGQISQFYTLWLYTAELIKQ